MFHRIFFLVAVFLFQTNTSIAQKTVSISIETNKEERSYTIYAENTSYATHTVELRFAVLENLESSVEKEDMVWEVGNGKTKLLTLKPIDNTKTTDFRYKKKSRKGVTKTLSELEKEYDLPIVIDNAVAAFEYKEVEQDALIYYAIGFDAEENTAVLAAKEGMVTEIVEIQSPATETEPAKTIRKYIEIEHKDGSFARYEVQLNSKIIVEVGQILPTGETIMFLMPKTDASTNDLVFSVSYTAFEEVIRNGEKANNIYFKAYVPIEFNSKAYDKLVETSIATKTLVPRINITGKKFDADAYKAKKKEERKEKNKKD